MCEANPNSWLEDDFNARISKCMADLANGDRFTKAAVGNSSLAFPILDRPAMQA